MPARPSCGQAQLRHRARCPSRLRSPPPPQAREERHPGTSHATPVAAVPLPRTARFPGPCTPAFRPAGRTAAGPGPASCAPPAARPDPLPRPRGSSPACPGRTGAGTRAARRTAPTPARAAPRWWLCGKRPRWCASGSRRWCGPGSTSRRGEQGSRPPLSNPALGPPRPARPGSRCFPRKAPVLRARRLGERAGGRGRTRPTARPLTRQRGKEAGSARTARSLRLTERNRPYLCRAECLLTELELPHGGHGANPDLARSTRGPASRTAPGC